MVVVGIGRANTKVPVELYSLIVVLAVIALLEEYDGEPPTSTTAILPGINGIPVVFTSILNRGLSQPFDVCDIQYCAEGLPTVVVEGIGATETPVPPVAAVYHKILEPVAVKAVAVVFCTKETGVLVQQELHIHLHQLVLVFGFRNHYLTVLQNKILLVCQSKK